VGEPHTFRREATVQSAEFGIAPTAGTPILAGILVDVSGSMVVATMGGEGLGDNGQTRIQAVSRALDELVAKGAEYSRQGAGQSAGSLL